MIDEGIDLDPTPSPPGLGPLFPEFMPLGDPAPAVEAIVVEPSAGVVAAEPMEPVAGEPAVVSHDHPRDRFLERIHGSYVDGGLSQLNDPVLYPMQWREEILLCFRIPSPDA